MNSNWFPVISKTLLFKNIDSEELRIILECLRPAIRNYRKNEYPAISGDVFEGIGILLSGAAAITKETIAGKRMIMAILEPGDLFGEMGAFSGEKIWPATVAALEDCSVMFLKPERITGNCEKLCPGHQILIQNLLRIISDKALFLNRKVEYLALKGMRRKISAFLLEQLKKTKSTTFTSPLNRNEMADFLNVSRPSLSRELCRMRDEGLIEFHQSSFRIKNINALKKLLQ